MRLKQFLGLAIAILLAGFIYPASSQTVPAATRNGGGGYPPLAVGAGIASVNVDWQTHGRMFGESVWLDYAPSWVPSPLRGIGLEGELRDINFGRPSTLPSNMEEQSYLGSVMYTWRHYRHFHPYGKFGIGYGKLEFLFPGGGSYTEDSRTIEAAGGGFEYRAIGNLWARADYQYQFWHDLFGGRTLNPQGFTLGATWRFSLPHVR